MNKKPLFVPELDQTHSYLVMIMRAGQSILKAYNRCLDPLGLTFTQTSILFILWETEKRKHEVSLHELGKMLGVSMANTTGLIDRLERDKLLCRKQKEEDRRSYTVELTIKGREIVQFLEKNWPPPEMKEVDRLFQDMAMKDRQKFMELLFEVICRTEGCEDFPFQKSHT